VVFLIQNTQNRGARALHLNLDELIRSKHDARNRLIDLEDCTDQELDAQARVRGPTQRRHTNTA
jgi:low affinity Fe/Cu permease